MKNTIQNLAGILLLFILLSSCNSPTAEVVPETKSPDKSEQRANEKAFKTTLQKHLTAVSQKDLRTLKSTLSPKGDMYLILPSSKVKTKVSEFMDMHEEWFQDSTWTFETEILHTDVSGEMGIALVESMYREPERNGKPYFHKMAISYALRKMNGHWYVIKDHACSLEKTK